MIQKQRFYVEYEHFWSLDPMERNRSDGSFLALVFIMLAMGTQFISLPLETSRSETSEFYASASHQALRMSSYLNRPTIRTIQAMVLMTYFLLNDNHPSDGWAFAGILSRQAYAMGLNRDPAILNPSFTTFQRQERRRLWQAVLIQDTFMTVLLKLPPTATHADVDLTSFDEDERAAGPGYEENDNNDVGYIRGMWTLALLVQETISSPRSLSLPMAPTPRHRTQLLSRFRAAYRSFPDIFRAWDESSICDIAKYNKRLVLQTLFLTSNYYHCLMLVQAEEDTVDGSINLRGAMEAAHEAIKSFFVLHALLESEASVWWVFCHRAFTEAVRVILPSTISQHLQHRYHTNAIQLVLADLLRKAHQNLVSSPISQSQSHSPSSSTSPTSPAHPNPHYCHSHSNSQSSPLHSQPHLGGLSNPLPGPVEPLFAKARTDVLRMVQILELNQVDNDVCRTRVEVLRNYL
jgi:Fungal specific transcription factor domain